MQLMMDVSTLGGAPASGRHDPSAIAQRGIQGAGQQLPFREEIQRSFGPHDISQVQAHVGGGAADASRELAAQAYAHGDHVAFATDPTLFIAAHEAAHVVQQRAGVSLKAIDAGSDDAYERHADEVASAVVRGESAAPLFGQLPSGGGGASHAVQRKGEGGPTTASAGPAPRLGGKELYLSHNADKLWFAVGDYLQRINFPAPDPRLQWRDEPLFTARLVQALRGSVDLRDRSQLLAVLYPAQPFGAIDGLVPLNAQGAPLDLTWSPAVGHAIAPLFVDAVVASQQRLGPRWVAVAEHSPEREGQLNENKSLVSFKALVKSAPMDISVAQALTSAAVVELIGSGKPKSAKPRPLRKLNSFRWQGPKLWNWIKVTEPADATAEEVAATLWAHSGSEKTGPASYYAYGITAAPPLFGIPPTWAIQFEEAKRYAPAKVSEGSQEQRLLEVASSDAADELAVAQASHETGSKEHATVEQLRMALGDCATQLNYLIATLARFKLDAPVTNALRWVLVRQTELASAAPEDAAKWESAIIQQKKQLATIVSGVQQVASSGNPEAEPIKRLLSTYAHAAGVSFMAASCKQLVASALAQQGTLALQGVRGAAADLQESVAQFEQASGHTLDPKRFDNPDDIVARCNELQSQMLAGKQVDGTALETTLLQAQEVALYAKIDGLRAQLKQLREQAAAVGEGTLSTIVAQFHGSFRSVPDAADALEADLAGVEEIWHADTQFASITTSGPDRDDNMRAARRKVLDAAQQRFTQIAGNGNSKISRFLRDAATALKSQTKYVRIAAICIQLLAMLGVSFVASIAGGVVSRFVGSLLVRGGGAELAEMSLGARALAAAGRAATFGAGVATEAAVNVAGQHALGQKDEDASLSTEMLENMIMIGGAQAILGRIGHELEFAQKLEKEAGVTWKTNAKAMIAANTATITTHAVLNIALSYVAHQVTTAAGIRKESEHAIAANSVQLNEWFMQGLSVGLGRLVHSRFAPRVEMYKRLAQLPKLPEARLLPAKAESLLHIASTPESRPSAELVPPLMGKPRELLTDEKSVFDELARAPETRRAAGMSDSEVAAARHQNAADRADIHVPGSESVPLLNAGLEDLGGGKLWAGTSTQIEAAIDAAHQAQLDVHDTNANGIHTLTIEGRAFEVHERNEPGPRGDEAKAGDPKRGGSPTPAEGAHGGSVARPKISGALDLKGDASPDNVARQIGQYIAKQLNVDPETVAVKPLEGGRSGASVFRVRIQDRELGIFKIFGDDASVENEVRMMKLLHAKNMHVYDVVGEMGQVKISTGEGPRGGLLMETARGKSIEGEINSLPPIGDPAYRAAVASLESKLKLVARGMAEMHMAFARGSSESVAQKRSEAQFIVSKFSRLSGKMSRGDLNAITSKLEAEVIPAFIDSPVPATAYHGDANAGNFIVDSDSKLHVIDVGTMKYSLDAQGKGNDTGAADLGRFVESVEVAAEGRLSPADIQRIQHSFLAEYFASTKLSPADFYAGIKLFRVELEIAVINHATTQEERNASVNRIGSLLGVAITGEGKEP